MSDEEWCKARIMNYFECIFIDKKDFTMETAEERD